jgi:E3 ubiquitin-protein ligase DOA10
MQDDEIPACRICFEPDDLIQPCNCSGSTANVHKKCLIKWLKVSQRRDCEICHYKYIIIVKEPKQEYFFAPTKNMDNLILCIGIFLMIPITPITYFLNLTLTDVYFTSNVIWVLATLCVLRRVFILQTVTFWKLCLTIGSVLVSWQNGFWEPVMFDLAITFLCFLSFCACKRKNTATI